MLPILQLLVTLLDYGEGKCCPVFSRWCRRYAVHFTAVGAAFYTTAGVNAARFSTVGVSVILPILLLLLTPFDTTARANAARLSTVGVGVMLPILPLLVPPFTLRLG